MPQTGSFSIELAWLFMRWSSRLHFHQIQQFFIHRFGTPRQRVADRLRGAMTQMIAHQRASYRAQGFLYGRNLHQNIGAIAVFADEALQAADLSLDPPQTLQ